MPTTLEPYSEPECQWGQWAQWALRDIREALAEETRVMGKLAMTAHHWMQLAGLMRRTQDEIRAKDSRRHERAEFVEIGSGLVSTGEILVGILNQLPADEPEGLFLTREEIQAALRVLKLSVQRWQAVPSRELIEEFEQKCLSGAA